jgi:hypothetical protein
MNKQGARYGFVSVQGCRCIHCGWLVPADSVTLSSDVDVAYDETSPERCSESACVSERVCGPDGRTAHAGQS